LRSCRLRLRLACVPSFGFVRTSRMSKADAFEAEARRLDRAFHEAVDRIDARLAEISALPYGVKRTALVTAARLDAQAARHALEARRAQSATLRAIPPGEDAALAQTFGAIERLLTTLEELHPRAEA
jgi:hypothetical protein